MAAKLAGAPEERVWIHCASLGEFEQGRPVIGALRRRYPGAVIVLSFFSPSGYEVRKDYPGADHVFYLPLDTGANAEVFVRLLNPSLAVFVKYEFWYHYLTALQASDIPVLLISAVFREDQVFFKWYGKLFRSLLRRYRHIFVQDAPSLALLKRLNLSENASMGGDTRFDRVLAIASASRSFPVVEEFLEGRKAWVAGSTWPADEQLLAGYFRREPAAFKWIIAPHEIDEGHLRQVEGLFEGDTVRYSALEQGKRADGAKVLLIDNVGMLSGLYRYGFAAYIGGGFNQGIHNVLEAAVFGLPVIFGPRHRKFREAQELMACGAAYTVSDTTSFARTVVTLLEPEILEKASGHASAYVKEHAGATDRILEYIQEKRFLTTA